MAEAIEEAGLDCSWTFLLNSDEETGSYYSDAALRAEASRHDAGLALEPALAGGELAVERMGSGQFCIRTYGRAAHVGRAFTEGVSAVTKLAECLLEVARMPRPDAGLIASVGPIGLVVVHGQRFEDAFHCRQRSLQLGERVDDLPHRVEQQERVPLERHDVADRRVPADIQVAAVPHDDHIDDGEQDAP